MSVPIPSGTRDVLPDESRELRAILDALRSVVDAAGYGEISTPALEYEAVVARGDLSGARPAYRVVDDHGDVLVLRSDMTVPIARVIATRFAHADPPFRFWYAAHAYRQVRPQRGMSRELLQMGIELAGLPGADGTAEAITVLAHGLVAAGLTDVRIGLGDASLFPSVLASLELSDDAKRAVLHELGTHDYVGLARALGDADLPADTAHALVSLAQRRGSVDVLAEVPEAVSGSVARLRDLHHRLPADVAARVIFDLGLVRDLNYYTGPVFEVYAPALGVAVGGGGRYDDLLGRFGRDLPAVGFAINIDRLHHALHGDTTR